MAFGLASSAASPFMLKRPDKGALEAAAEAERKAAPGRDIGRRTSFLLCELGRQLASRLSTFELADALPVSRGEIAEALGVSLADVKREIAALSLSGLVRHNSQGLRVTDWRRLCSVAGYDVRQRRFA